MGWIHHAGRLRLALGLVSCTAACSLGSGSYDDSRTPARTVPRGFANETWVTGLASPTAMDFAPDGRIFVAEQGGAIRVVKNGALVRRPFATLATLAVGERGLLGITFDPEFASNGHLYAYYTASTPTPHNRLVRLTARDDAMVPGSEATLVELDALGSATNHNGGAIHFGGDGKLYVGVGDGANGTHAQSMSNLFGKILRLNQDGSIPTDNPFHASATGQNRAIWALGLRNPFTLAFARDGGMFINDVGRSTFEEIDEGVAGANYGWPITEGPTSDARFRTPVFTYIHGTGRASGCAITGGVFYEPDVVTFPRAYVGKYFFADYCSDWIRVLDPGTNRASAFAMRAGAPVDLRVGPDGALYYLARATGAIGRIRYGAASSPRITSPPRGRTAARAESVTFDVVASGTEPLSYQWQRDGHDLAGATSPSYTMGATLRDEGAAFRVIVRNRYGSVTSDDAILSVTPNLAPSARIVTPSTWTFYRAGETIPFAGTGRDAEDGPLGPRNFSWQIVFHHDAHVHPFLPAVRGVAAGSFLVPDEGETATNVFFRVHLTVTDADGASRTATHDILPHTVLLTFRTEPPGLAFTLDGAPVFGAVSSSSVVGLRRSIAAASPQLVSGTPFVCVGWSDGSEASHVLATPSLDTTYVASFVPRESVMGLRAEYFDDTDFRALRVTRTDASVDFDWGGNAPADEIGADRFSVRWTGTVTPAFAESYTFYTRSDDGIRVWVDGARVIDNFTDHRPTENSGTTGELVAGRPYPIRIEYYERGGGAVARLAWSSRSQAKQVIPAARLAPPMAP